MEDQRSFIVYQLLSTSTFHTAISRYMCSIQVNTHIDLKQYIDNFSSLSRSPSGIEVFNAFNEIRGTVGYLVALSVTNELKLERYIPIDQISLLLPE